MLFVMRYKTGLEDKRSNQKIKYIFKLTLSTKAEKKFKVVNHQKLCSKQNRLQILPIAK